MFDDDLAPAERIRGFLGRHGRSLLLGGVLVLAFSVAATGVADEAARARADALFTRALVTFATARALDAVISAAQGTELALEPAGVGVTFSAGELLDPLNDLVEQFATVVLLAATSLGIQSLALRISAWWGFTALFGLAAAVWVVVRWRAGRPTRSSVRLEDAARRLVLVLLLVRFALPAVTLVSGWVFDAFLEPEQQASLEVLDATRDDVDALAEVGQAPPESEPRERASWLGRLRAWWGDRASGGGIEERLASFRDRIDDAVESIVRLIVIFVLQTLVMPLFLLWLTVRLVGSRIG